MLYYILSANVITIDIYYNYEELIYQGSYDEEMYKFIDCIIIFFNYCM